MVRVTISYQGLEGVGECTPYPRYEESVESVIEQIERWKESLAGLAPQRAKVLLQTRPRGQQEMPSIVRYGMLLANWKESVSRRHISPLMR